MARTVIVLGVTAAVLLVFDPETHLKTSLRQISVHKSHLEGLIRLATPQDQRMMSTVINGANNDAPLKCPSPSSSVIPLTISQRHATFWFDDGSLILQVQQLLFKVHQTRIRRHSRYLVDLLEANNFAKESNDQSPRIILDAEQGVMASDVEVLLEHIYSDESLGADLSFHRFSALLRASAPQQLDCPGIHDIAKSAFEDMFPGGPTPFLHPPFQGEALLLATQFNIPTARKALLYSTMTTTEFIAETESAKNISVHTKSTSVSSLTTNPDEMKSSPPHMRVVLSPENTEICTRLMTRIIDHFTPILFTPTTSSHMVCTDAFADAWTAHVIQPALQNEGVYKPLETLESMKCVDWGKLGICPSCVVEKCEVWTAEQQNIWELVDDWIR